MWFRKNHKNNKLPSPRVQAAQATEELKTLLLSLFDNQHAFVQESGDIDYEKLFAKVMALKEQGADLDCDVFHHMEKKPLIFLVLDTQDPAIIMFYLAGGASLNSIRSGLGEQDLLTYTYEMGNNILELVLQELYKREQPDKLGEPLNIPASTHALPNSDRLEQALFRARINTTTVRAFINSGLREASGFRLGISLPLLDGYTLLHRAAKEKRIETVKLLLKYEANPLAPSRFNNKTPRETIAGESGEPFEEIKALLMAAEKQWQQQHPGVQYK